MEFGNRNYLFFLTIPIMILIITIMGVRKKNKILKILNLEWSKTVRITQIALYFLGSIALVIALLSPQILREEENHEVRGLDIYAIIDTSRSMLAEDTYPNRLERGKKAIEELLKNLKGDRIGFIPFSDIAYVQMPLTDDYSMAKNYLGAIDSQLISGGGTDLLSALKIADRSFKESGAKEKVVLIVSDGGDADSEITEYLKNSDLKIYSIGVGSDTPSVMPEYVDGQKRGFIRDEKGDIATSVLNSELLKSISNGGYYEINNLSDNSEKFLENIATLERNSLRKERVKLYDKYFQYPLFIGLILILLAYFLRGGVRDEKKR